MPGETSKSYLKFHENNIVTGGAGRAGAVLQYMDWEIRISFSMAINAIQ